MPNSLHHLCYSIANVIEYSYNQEVQNNDVHIAEMDYLSRQNSDLSMFNILNYGNGDDYKTPNGDFSTTPISVTPFSTTPVSANNFLGDDKEFDRSRSNSFSLDIQNIYNQSIYSTNISDRDKSNGSLNINNNLNYPLSASPSRNSFKHKKYESYTAGLVYNLGFNNLKNASNVSNISNISNSSNINGFDSEEESVNGSNKYLNIRYSYNRPYKEIIKHSNHNSNNSSLERLDNTKEPKSDENNNVSIAIERRNSQDKDRSLKQQRRYNIFSNEFYSKGFTIQNQSSDNKNSNTNSTVNNNIFNGDAFNSIFINSEEDLLCTSPTCNSLNIEDDEESIKLDEIKAFSKRNSFKKREDSGNTDEADNDTYREDGCNSIYEHLNDRDSYTIEEEEEENIREERNSHRCNSGSDSDDKNNDHTNKNKKVDNEEDKSNNNDKSSNKNEINIETIDINNEEEEEDDDEREINNDYDDNNVNNAFDENSDQEDIFNINDIEYDLYNEETINYFVSNYENNDFLEQFMKKENYQVKEIISGTYINVNKNDNKIKEKSTKSIANEEERGHVIRLSTLQNELFSAFDDNSDNNEDVEKESKYDNEDTNDIDDEDDDNQEKDDKDDDNQEKDDKDDDNQEKDDEDESSIISGSVTRVTLKQGSSISDSLNGSKSDLDVQEMNRNRISDRPNYRRNNSENFNNYDSLRNYNNDISDDDIHMSVTLLHAKQSSQSSLLSRKNELGLKIETNNIKKPKKNIIHRLSDDIDPYFDQNKKYNKKEIKEFASATVKGNPKIVEPRGPISSIDAEEETEERYFVSLNDLECKNDYRKSKLEKQGSGFFLTKVIEYTNSEKVVGTFLFLRFFVPAITSPENFGLTHSKISINERKSLIICGKVLTALCNNVNFGGKEKYMEYLNPFLQVHREEAREFLQWAMSINEDQVNSAVSPSQNEAKDLLSSKTKSYEIEFENLISKSKYECDYSSENSSYNSLTIQEPNAPSPGFALDDRFKGKNDSSTSPKKKNQKNRASRDESHFSSMPILNIDTNSSLEQLTIKEKSPLIKESFTGSKNSIYGNHRQNLKLGSVRVKHVPLNDTDCARGSIKNINTNEIKKDYDVEVRDIISFLTKNIHLLEKEIESKTNIIPPEESEGVYSGFLELKQLIFLSEDNNSMKSWFKKIFRSKYSNSMESLTMQKSSSKSRRSSNNSILLN